MCMWIGHKRGHGRVHGNGHGRGRRRESGSGWSGIGILVKIEMGICNHWYRSDKAPFFEPPKLPNFDFDAS
jgi:hypothetical protein